MAESCSVAHDFVRAAYLYSLIARNGEYPQDSRAMASSRAAGIFREQLKDYDRAADAYENWSLQIGDLGLQNRIADTLAELRKQAGKYREINEFLDTLGIGKNLPHAVAQRDVEKLNFLRRKYPAYYALARIEALLANRHIVLANWGRAFYFGLRAERRDPFLKYHSSLLYDIRFSRDRWFRNWGMGLSYLMLAVAVIFLIRGKFWRRFTRGHFLRGLIFVGSGFVFNLLVYGLLMLSPVSTPAGQGLTYPVIVIFGSHPFMAKYLWIFLAYAIAASTLIFFQTLAWSAAARGASASVRIFLHALAISLCASALFYFHHAGEWFYQGGNFYLREDIETYARKYPHLFREYPDILKASANPNKVAPDIGKAGDSP